MRCELCSNKAIYTYNNINMCEACLFQELLVDEKIKAKKVIEYYLDNNYVGSSCEGVDINDIADYLNIKQCKFID